MYLLWDEVIVIRIGTHTGSKRRFIQDFTLTASTGIVESKLQKHGWPPSRNPTTGKKKKSGPLREQPTETARIEPITAVEDQPITAEHSAL